MKYIYQMNKTFYKTKKNLQMGLQNYKKIYKKEKKTHLIHII